MKRILSLTVLVLLAFIINAQEINEGFEEATFPPAGWETFIKTTSKDYDDVYWELSNINPHTGSQSAYSGWYATDEEGWLVTSLYTPSATNHTLSFFQKQWDEGDDYSSVLTIRVSTTSQTTPDDFTIIDTQVETDFDESWSLHEVDLSAYIGTPIYIAFVHDTNEDGDNWYIDDVTTETLVVPEITTNPTPADASVDILIVNSDTSRIDFNWDAPTSGPVPDQYDFYVSADQNNLVKIGSPTVTSAHPHTFHFNTTYYWKAVSVNAAGDAVGSSVWSFTTVQQPTLTAPYTITFDEKVPDGCDQLITNEDWWEYTNVVNGHIGNAGDDEGTSTESGGYFAHIDDSSPNSQNTSFLTQFFDVSSLNEPAVSFYLMTNDEGSGNAELTVSVWDGANWNDLFTSNTNTAGWELKTIDLSTLTITGNIQVKFKVVENASDGYKDDLAIDDIKIYDANPEYIEEINDNNISLYPNPANEKIFLYSESNIKKVIIYNISGKIISEMNYNKKDIDINISELSNGLYFIDVLSDSKHNVLKFEKK